MFFFLLVKSLSVNVSLGCPRRGSWDNMSCTCRRPPNTLTDSHFLCLGFLTTDSCSYWTGVKLVFCSPDVRVEAVASSPLTCGCLPPLLPSCRVGGGWGGSTTCCQAAPLPNKEGRKWNENLTSLRRRGHSSHTSGRPRPQPAAVKRDTGGEVALAPRPDPARGPLTSPRRKQIWSCCSRMMQDVDGRAHVLNTMDIYNAADAAFTGGAHVDAILIQAFFPWTNAAFQGHFSARKLQLQVTTL